jgi:tetratricopeptide (TPR) repeat protein
MNVYYGIRAAGGRPLRGRRLMRVLAAALLIAFCPRAGYAFQEKGRVSSDDHAAAIAATLVNQGRCEEAIGILEPLCENRPDLHRAAEQLASCYIELGLAERAVDFLESRIAGAPAHVPFARLLGNAYLDLGEREMALGAWRRILGDDPRLSRNYGLVGRLMIEAGFYEEAIETYRGGRVFGTLFRPYTAEIIRLERLLGRNDTAFREVVALIGSAPGLNVGDVQLLADIYAESGLSDRLFAIADSAAAETEGGRFDIIRAVLLLEAGRYGEAERYIEGRGALADREFYSFISYLSTVWRERKETGFSTFYRKALDAFLALYPGSPVAPEVMLVLAESLREEALLREGLEELFVKALRTIELVKEHKRGNMLLERAAILEAEILLEDLHRPRDAIAALEGIRFHSKEGSRRAEEIRMTALVRAGAWDEVERRSELLEASGDSVKAAIGLYGKGSASFFRGKYGEAVEIMSSLAESYPGSSWANDALERALLVEETLREGPEPLDCYRGALALRVAGSPGAAADSLGALIERYPSSALLPRALYERAELDIDSGMEERAVRGLERLAELYPLSELAPRALERLALLERERDVGRAKELYEAILERYPDDPFLERVRRAYMALRRSTGEEE